MERVTHTQALLLDCGRGAYRAQQVVNDWHELLSSDTATTFSVPSRGMLGGSMHYEVESFTLVDRAEANH